MKKLIFLLLLIPSLCFGGNVASVSGVADASIASIDGITGTAIGTMEGQTYNDGDVGCTTASDGLISTDAQSYGDADNQTLAIADTTKKKAGVFVLAAQSTITEYVVRWYKVGAADSFTGYCSIYTNCVGAGDPAAGCAEANNPAAEVADTGATVASADITEDTFDDEVMTLSTPKAGLAAGTYWLVCKLSARTSGTGVLSIDNAGLSSARFGSADDGSTWTDTANQTLRHKVFGCAD